MTDKRQPDIEVLSAYIDGMLADKERSRLEARLSREPNLRAELDSLRMTRDLLRSAPHYAAPRNFTLTPEMAGIRSPQRGALFSLSRLAFTFTTVLFAVALVGNFAFRGVPLPQPEAATAFEVQSLDEADPAGSSAVDDSEDSAAAEDMQALEAADTAPMEESAAGDTSLEQASEPMEEPAGGGADPGSGEAESFAPPEEESQSVAAEAVEEAAEPEAEMPDESERSVEEDTAEALLPGATAKNPSDGEAGSAQPALPPDTTGTQQVNFWSIFVLLTGAAALFSGGLTWYLRNR